MQLPKCHGHLLYHALCEILAPSFLACCTAWRAGGTCALTRDLAPPPHRPVPRRAVGLYPSGQGERERERAARAPHLARPVPTPCDVTHGRQLRAGQKAPAAQLGRPGRRQRLPAAAVGSWSRRVMLAPAAAVTPRRRARRGEL